ncbi:hypothetical protein [Mycobacterium malmoense]|uniref:hypothetical protein n=1 Tax=Mycobacterium malmoense TaxID=1780 RepID=UPI0011467031|nr:hypothetical protein [Mycobacterium malmoense]
MSPQDTLFIVASCLGAATIVSGLATLAGDRRVALALGVRSSEISARTQTERTDENAAALRADAKHSASVRIYEDSWTPSLIRNMSASTLFGWDPESVYVRRDFDDQLRRILRAAGAGQGGRLVVVVGAPGTGKTTSTAMALLDALPDRRLVLAHRVDREKIEEISNWPKSRLQSLVLWLDDWHDELESTADFVRTTVSRLADAGAVVVLTTRSLPRELDSATTIVVPSSLTTSESEALLSTAAFDRMRGEIVGLVRTDFLADEFRSWLARDLGMPQVTPSTDFVVTNEGEVALFEIKVSSRDVQLAIIRYLRERVRDRRGRVTIYLETPTGSDREIRITETADLQLR